MDTQRLILFVDLLVLRALAVGGVAEGASAAAADRRGDSAQPDAGDARRRRARRAVRRRAAAAARRAAAPARRAAARRRGAARPDRHDQDRSLHAPRSTRWAACITQVALDAAPRCRRQRPSRISRCRRNAERTFVAQSGLLGDGMPNHRTRLRGAARPARARAGRRHARGQAARRPRANGDKVVQTLTFHRGSYVIDVAYDITNAGTAPIAPYAYFQLTRDTKTQWLQNSMAPVVVRRARSSTTRPTSSRRSTSARSTRTPPTRRASCRTPRTPTTAGSAWSSTTSSPRGCRPTTRRRRASSTRASSTTASTPPACVVPTATIAPGATGDDRRAALRRPAGPGRARQARQGPRPGRRLRHLHVIAAPLFWLLKWLHGLIGNWGWAIIAA